MIGTADATLTDFLRDPNGVVERLEHVDVVLHRRNAGDLRLTLSSRSEAVNESVRLVARLLGTALKDELVRQRLGSSAGAIPWLRFLPVEGRSEFLAEFFQCAEASAELGTMAPLAQLLSEWQATAAIYADPELHAELLRPSPGDGPRVPKPTVG